MRTIALAAALLTATPAVAQPAYILGIIDGDSYRASINGQVETIRLAHADTPEKGQRARCAKEQELADRAATRVGELLLGKTVDLQARGREKYGRLLAAITVDGRDLAAVLIGEGLAVPYEGRGVRADWCR